MWPDWWADVHAATCSGWIWRSSPRSMIRLGARLPKRRIMSGRDAHAGAYQSRFVLRLDLFRGVQETGGLAKTARRLAQAASADRGIRVQIGRRSMRPGRRASPGFPAPARAPWRGRRGRPRHGPALPATGKDLRQTLHRLALPRAHLVRMNPALRGDLLQRPIAPQRLKRKLRLLLP